MDDRFGMPQAVKGSGTWVAITLELESWPGVPAFCLLEVETKIFFIMIFVFQMTLLASLEATDPR